MSSLSEARAFAAEAGLPLVVRPAFTLGGTGGGFCETDETLTERVGAGLAASPISQVLIERSLAGWRELEYEVMRDASGTCITVCNMENIDPMGVHTGDSIVVAPAQTLTDREHQQLRSAALRIISALDIEGGCNVQFAMHPESHEYFVIEVNPRVSRSSALASKATGYPIARVAAKIAAGRRLDEIPNAVTGRTCAAFEPALDYCVVKIPRWPFDKFPDADRRLGTQMKSTGEVMAIERSFEAAFNKAIRSLEQRRPDVATLRDRVLVESPNDRRVFAVMEALRGGADVAEVSRRSTIAPWFVRRMHTIVECEERIRWGEPPAELLTEAKHLGIGDARIAALRGEEPGDVRSRREALGLVPVYKCVDTCAAEFEAQTPYYYSTYEVEDEGRDAAIGGDCVVVLGSGPIRIGQGIEFDYCSVQAALAIRAAGVEAVMINSNPETVSTDFDCSDRLYFEPLDAESALSVIAAERPRGVVVQFGGQTAVNLARPLHAAGVTILGSDVDTIDGAEDRRLFEALMRSLDIPQPRGAATTDITEAMAIGDRIGYPVLVRPSYVLGGRAMEVVHSRDALERYLVAAMAVLPEDGSQRRGTVLVDKYLFGTEVDVDAICDGETVVIPGLMEHIERAGVHSGDSMAAYPAPRLEPSVRDQIVADTVRIALALRVRGLCNIQFVVYRGRAHVIEVNPRASRTVPFLSKVSGVPMVELAVRVMGGADVVCAGLVHRAGATPAVGGGQGAGLLHGEAHRCRQRPRPGDEVHGRGDGDRRRPRRRAGEGVSRGTGLGAEVRGNPLQHRGLRQGRGLAHPRPAERARVHPVRDRRHRDHARAGGDQRHRSGKGGPRATQRHRRHRGGQGAAGHQHRLPPRHGRARLPPRRGRVGGSGGTHGEGRLPHPARRRAATHPMLHIARHCSSPRRRDDQAAGW